MRIFYLILLTLLAHAVQAKEVSIRANVVQRCASFWQDNVRSHPHGLSTGTVAELQIDCLPKMAWVKIDKRDEQQWQRVSIDY